MNSVVHFVSNPTVIELKVKILYVICFAFNVQLQIFHNTKVDILYEYLFLVFLLFIHTGQYRKCTSVRERRTRHQKGPRAGTLSRITQSTTTLYAQGSWF